MTYYSENESTEYIYSISDITQEIKVLLESSFPPVWIQGEISNYTHHSSGHMYFSLKDANAQISAVMWASRNAGLLFTPQSGMKIKAYGTLKLYEKRGTYQFDVQKMMPSGVGELQAAFEHLKNKLRDEGLFDTEIKLELPSLPQKIGIVTSPTGAAIHDLWNVLQRRLPSVEVILRPAKVQGDGAADDIAKALKEFNEYNDVDVLIVGRGGGSLEDLWAFNEEVVARAIFESQIPVISAVGHEIDFTISDFVADFRAATPSAAAEIVVPDAQELKGSIQSILTKSGVILHNLIASKRERLNALLSSYGLGRPQDYIFQLRQELDELSSRNNKAIRNILQLKQNSFRSIDSKLTALHPDSILKRGYSIVTRIKDKSVVKDAAELNANDSVQIKFNEGKATAKITGTSN